MCSRAVDLEQKIPRSEVQKKKMVFRQAEIDTQFFTPRNYQLELVDKAKHRNIIVPLGTGTGKTFIAVMLIKEFAADIRVPFDQKGKRSFFLVDKVPLVYQQAEQIRCHCNLSVGEYHGRMNVDIWNSDRWNNELSNNHIRRQGELFMSVWAIARKTHTRYGMNTFNRQIQRLRPLTCPVMVMTAQIFYDLLNHGFFSLDRANLLIFDECHHATKGHPYRKIMEIYHKLPNNRIAPRILGLTASVISAQTKPSKLENLMKDLEGSLNCSIETASDLVSVAKYGARPREVVIKCKDFDPNTCDLCRPVKELLEGPLNFAQSASFHPDLDVDPTRPVIEAFARTKG